MNNDSKMDKYLRSTETINWKHPEILKTVKALSLGVKDPDEIARRCFLWVRDKIKHSYDHQLSPVTCSASEVLAAGTGYCFSKSHLLAAFLRASSIPAGFCYQRLSRDDNGPPFVLHGLVAVQIPQYGWYRIDPRGNRPDVDTRFTPPIERIAFHPTLPGEADLPEIWPDPLPSVVEALRAHKTWDALWANLPDIDLLLPAEKRPNPADAINRC
jgi:transglutaminase-like putative cysteine protease